MLWLDVIRHCIVHHIDKERFFFQICLLKMTAFLKPKRMYCNHFSMLQMCNDCRYFVTGYCWQRSRWRRQWWIYLIYLTPKNLLFWGRVKCHLPCIRIWIWQILGLCTVISRCAWLDIVALCLACQTLEPIPGWALVFFLFLFCFLMQNFFIQEIWNYKNDKKYNP